jgi:hypothetical protein
VKIRPYTALFKDSTARISAPGLRSGYGPFRSTWVSLILLLHITLESRVRSFPGSMKDWEWSNPGSLGSMHA